MYNSKQASLNKKTVFLLVLALLAIVACLFFILEKNGITNLYTKPHSDVQTVNPQPNINYGPPTEEEKAAGDTQKEINDQKDTSPTSPTEVASLVITDATQYDSEIEVRAFVSNTLKSGVCEYTFKNGSITFSKSMPANPDASTTPCMTLTLSRTDFATAGTWNLTVSYKSGDGSLAGSASTNIEIQ